MLKDIRETIEEVEKWVKGGRLTTEEAVWFLSLAIRIGKIKKKVSGQYFPKEANRAHNRDGPYTTIICGNDSISTAKVKRVTPEEVESNPRREPGAYFSFPCCSLSEAKSLINQVLDVESSLRVRSIKACGGGQAEGEVELVMWKNA